MLSSKRDDLDLRGTQTMTAAVKAHFPLQEWELIPGVYLDPGPFADVDPPETVEAIWIRFREARGQNGAATLSQIAAAGN